MRVYLSGVKSRTHLLYAASYVDALVERGQTPVTLVDLGVGTFAGAARVTHADVRDVLERSGAVEVVDVAHAGGLRAPHGEPVAYVSVGAPGLKPYARLRAANRLRHLHVVVTDEGLGTYGDWHTRLDALRRQGARGPWPVVRSLAISGGRRLLTDERWALYREDAGRWVVDERVAAPLRAVVGPVDAGRRVVFLSQPWVELGLVSAADHVAFLTSVAAAVTAAGLEPAVRPHPVEDAGRLAGLRVLPGTGPAELDPAVVGAAAVLGGPSTALLNVSALHGTRALRVRLPDRLAAVETGLGAAQAALLDTFLPPPVRPAELTERLAGQP